MFHLNANGAACTAQIDAFLLFRQSRRADGPQNRSVSVCDFLCIALALSNAASHPLSTPLTVDMTCVTCLCLCRRPGPNSIPTTADHHCLRLPPLPTWPLA